MNGAQAAGQSVCGYSDGTLRLFSASGDLRLDCQPGRAAFQAACDVGGGRVAVGDAAGVLRIWDVASATLLLSSSSPSSSSPQQHHHRGLAAATATTSSSDGPSSRGEAASSGAPASIHCVVALPGSRCATGHGGGQCDVRLWQLDGEEIRQTDALVAGSERRPLPQSRACDACRSRTAAIL